MATINAQYRSSGIQYNATTNVLVSNIVASLGGSHVLSNGGAFALTLNGAPTQSYAFQAATNLPPPANVWVTLSNVVTGPKWPVPLHRSAAHKFSASILSRSGVIARSAPGSFIPGSIWSEAGGYAIFASAANASMMWAG